MGVVDIHEAKEILKQRDPDYLKYIQENAWFVTDLQTRLYAQSLLDRNVFVQSRLQPQEHKEEKP